MTGSPHMIFMSDRGSEKCHHPVTGVLVDGASGAMNLFPENFEAAIHDVMNIFRVQLFGNSREVDHVSKKNGDQLILSLKGAVTFQDTFQEKGRGVIARGAAGVSGELCPCVEPGSAVFADV